jgi:cell division protein FtsL
LKDLLELQQKAASSGKSCKVKKLAIARLEKKTQEPNSS